MDFDAYARTAVDLVNAPLADLPGLRAFLGAAHGWMREETTDRDVAAFRRAQRRLREVFELGTRGRDTEAVAELNALLEQFPVQPRISGHGADPAPRHPAQTDPAPRHPAQTDPSPRDPARARDWHMHVTSRGSSVSAEYLAGAVWGLAVWLCEYGSARFGICADERCGNVYLDTSSNNCRRFCSERCATRSHVAAHRARKRAAVGGAADAPVLAPVP